MILRYSVAALALGLPAIGLQALAYRAASSLGTGKSLPIIGMDPLYVALMGSALSTLFMVVALGLYARAKGQSIFLGFLGVFSCIGLMAVALLPDKTKKGKS